jgi:uncharacterized protein YwgA
MKRLQKAVILAELADKMRNHGSWCGETHIQKAVYFLQELLKVPLAYRYVLYKHGPFSFDLRDEITELRVYELFRLEPRPVPYGPSFRPTANAEELKSRFPKTLNNYGERLAFVAETLDGKGVAELEKLATALYVSLESKGASKETRARRISELKPHVLQEQALEAVRELDRIKKEARNLLPK